MKTLLLVCLTAWFLVGILFLSGDKTLIAVGLLGSFSLVVGPWIAIWLADSRDSIQTLEPQTQL